MVILLIGTAIIIALGFVIIRVHEAIVDKKTQRTKKRQVLC